jgi:hypothetical protein
MAAAFDPTLREAVNRSSILNANISSGNIGMDVRNDIAWRRQWVERLTETEQFFHNFHQTETMPYTLFYSSEIRQGAINYQNETVVLSIATYLYSSGIWVLSIERALQAVYDGLRATGRMSTWGLASWPQQGVTNLNAFSQRQNNFSVVFELLNSQNSVIGRQTLQTAGSWGLNWSGRPTINISSPDRRTLNFQNVNANHITDRMTIRVATVNGIDARTAARDGILQIRAVNRSEVEMNDKFSFVKGEILGFAQRPRGEAISLVIPDTIWGDPVISIGVRAFMNNNITSVIIPNSVRVIGAEAFLGCRITRVTIGENVVIGNRSFGYRFSWVSEDGVTKYFDNIGFLNTYVQNERKAGTYTILYINDNRWIYDLQGDDTNFREARQASREASERRANKTHNTRLVLGGLVLAGLVVWIIIRGPVDPETSMNLRY